MIHPNDRKRTESEGGVGSKPWSTSTYKGARLKDIFQGFVPRGGRHISQSPLGQWGVGPAVPSVSWAEPTDAAGPKKAQSHVYRCQRRCDEGRGQAPHWRRRSHAQCGGANDPVIRGNYSYSAINYRQTKAWSGKMTGGKHNGQCNILIFSLNNG